MLTDKERFIITSSNEFVPVSDAIIILEGDYHNRIKKGCRLYNAGFGKYLVFSGGIKNLDYGSYPFELVKSYFGKYNVEFKEVVLEEKSQNTREQAIEVINMCMKYKWKKIILVASHFHQYRAFLTFLKILLEKNLQEKLIIYNDTERELNWFSINENEKKTRYDLLGDEFEKIDVYASTGHIATYEEALIYHRWKEQQS